LAVRQHEARVRQAVHDHHGILVTCHWSPITA
jgi:hypothetical protein